jgi:hypothetical protein
LAILFSPKDFLFILIFNPWLWAYMMKVI